eukprot:2072329-Lingulodinium_polyedra.AAC.1
MSNLVVGVRYIDNVPDNVIRGHFAAWFQCDPLVPANIPAEDLRALYRWLLNDEVVSMRLPKQQLSLDADFE